MKHHIDSRSICSAFLFFGISLLIIWVSWCVYSSHSAVPGLLDDGIHIKGARRYVSEGFLDAVLWSFAGFINGERFYEVHFFVLGLYHTFFDQNLVLWYAGNMLLASCVGIGLYYIIFSITGNVSLGIFACGLFLTSSPIAETLRGNFGKAEPVMLALLVGGLFFWCLFARSKKWFWLLIGIFLFVLGCVTKESGKLVAASMCLPWILTSLPFGLGNRNKADRELPFFSLFIVGAFGILFSYLVTIPTRNFAYLHSYFSLDFSLEKIKSSISFYLLESPDFLIILGLTTLLYLVLLLRRQLFGTPLIFGLTCLTIVWAYFLCLLGFKFNLVYYIYIPFLFLVLSLGLVLKEFLGSHPRIISLLLVLILLTRVYSVPYLFFIADIQRYFDSVNYKAMLYTKSKASGDIYALDLREDSQIVQEWNCLSNFFKALEGNSLLYGAAEGFNMWSYQDQWRYVGRLAGDPRALKKVADGAKDYAGHWVMYSWRTQLPKAGDYLTCRYGSMVVGKHFLRAAIPFEQSAEPFFALLDKRVLTKTDDVYEETVVRDPSTWREFKLSGGWSFYRVDAPLGFSAQDYTPDQWMTKKTSILIPEDSRYSKLAIHMHVPQAHSFPIRVWAEVDGVEVSGMEVKEAGDSVFEIPVKKNQVLKIHSSSWFQPAKLGLSADTRDLSVRFLKIEGE
jgi:hypothetical protein